ncbi:hypothetical protein GGR53DRAFT_463371 [Hypoxylon sp. FL1150]|nr:hypothetical protein GGR53DRAFT_463371 [Hypoxylon sp. FL1150]
MARQAGRQIRDALMTARQLARNRKERLDWDHLGHVIKAPAVLNKYRKAVKGRSDEAWARQEQISQNHELNSPESKMSTLRSRYKTASFKVDQAEKDQDRITQYIEDFSDDLPDYQLLGIQEEIAKIRAVAIENNVLTGILDSADLDEVERGTSPEEYNRISQALGQYENGIEKIQVFIDTCKGILGI